MPTPIPVKTFLLLLGLVVCTACVKKQEELDFFTVKTVQPESGGQLGIVMLKGTLDDIGPEGVEAHGFFWSDDKARVDAPDTLLTPRISLGPQKSNGLFTTDFSIPDARKTYYFRAFAKLGKRMVLAPEVEIFTLNLLLTIERGPNSIKTDNDQALVTAQVRGLDALRAGVSGKGFVWSSKNKVPLVGIDETIERNETTTTGDGYFADTLKGLNPATTYYIRAFLRTERDTFYSAVDNFKIKDVWRPVAQALPFGGQKVWGAFSAVDGNKAYVGCGCNASPDPSTGGYLCLEGNVLPEIWEFDAVDQTWRKLNILLPPSLKQSGAIAFVLDHQLYIGFGGYAKSNAKLLANDFWVLDLNTLQVTLLGKEFPGAGRIDAVTFTIDNRAYVGAGHGIIFNAPDEFYNDFYTFEPTTGWTRIDSLPTSINGAVSSQQGRWGATAFSDGKHGYVAGGVTGTNGIQTAELLDCWQYNPIGKGWFLGPALPEPRQDGLAFVIQQKAYLGLGWSTLLDRGFLHDWKVLDLTKNGSWENANPFRGPARADAFGFSILGQGYVGSGRGSNIKGTGYDLTIFGDHWRYFPE